MRKPRSERLPNRLLDAELFWLDHRFSWDVASFSGCIGLIFFVLAWIPQSWDTIRDGRCGANRCFLAFSALGSLSLTLYAFSRGDAVFCTLNALTTIGATINIYFSLFPRSAAIEDYLAGDR